MFNEQKILGNAESIAISLDKRVTRRVRFDPFLKLGMRRGTVAFSSQPDLEPDDSRRSLADIYKLHRRRETEGPNRLGVFQRFFSLFGSRPTSRKTSTASFTGTTSYYLSILSQWYLKNGYPLRRWSVFISMNAVIVFSSKLHFRMHWHSDIPARIDYSLRKVNRYTPKMIHYHFPRIYR